MRSLYKSSTFQDRGGRLPDGSPAKAESPKRNSNHALSAEVIDAIESLPQIQSKQWSKSYLAEQVWRNLLGLPADFDGSDLAAIFEGAIVE